jgi:hypothetical protein
MMVHIAFNPILIDYFIQSVKDPEMRCLFGIMALTALYDSWRIDLNEVSHSLSCRPEELQSRLDILVKSGAICYLDDSEEESTQCTDGSNSIVPKFLLPVCLESLPNVSSLSLPACPTANESTAPTNNSVNPLASPGELPFAPSPN